VAYLLPGDLHDEGLGWEIVGICGNLSADSVTGGMFVKTGWENESGLCFGNIENMVGLVKTRILAEGGMSKSGSL
jgi:hypothetical protein